MQKRIQFFITGLGPGGAERQLTGLAIMLKEAGYEVQVCWYTDINFYQQELNTHGVGCRQLFTVNHFKKVINIWSAIRQFHPDIVISFLDGPNTFCPLLKMLYRRFKLVVSERNTTQSLDWRTKLRFWAYRQADVIIPNSNSQKDFIVLHYPHYKKKIVTITNFTDLQKFNPVVSEIHGNQVTCLVAARITEPKNVKRFISAIGLLHQKSIAITVNWFGMPFYQAYYDECEQLIKKLNLDGVFRLLPPTKNLLTEYHNCDVVCLPSLFEGFPNVVCEALSCGLPVVCSNVCDNSILVENGVNGFLFNPLSVDDMAEKLEKFCSLPTAKRVEMCKQSRRKAEAMLSKDIFLRKYIDVIENRL